MQKSGAGSGGIAWLEKSLKTILSDRKVLDHLNTYFIC